MVWHIILCLAANSVSAMQIVSIYPDLHNGSSYVHVFVLDNKDIVDVQAIEFDDIVDRNGVGPVERSPDRWEVGDNVKRTTVKRQVWVKTLRQYGYWKEVDTSVLVNKDRNNAYLRINKYQASPTRSWPQGEISDIGHDWIRAGDGKLLAPHQSLKLENWNPGDKIRYHHDEGMYGTSWMIYNETLKEYAFPFWSISDDLWSEASYRVLSVETKGDFTHIVLDNQLKLKVAARKKWKIFNSPLFKKGDFAIVQVKDQGLVLIHPKTGEEVYARSYAGVAGLAGLSVRDSDATVTMQNHRYRWELTTPADAEVVKTWSHRAAVIAVNPEGNDYVLVNGTDFWYNSLYASPMEKDQYTFVSIRDPEPTSDFYPGFHQGLLPAGYHY